MSAIGGDLRQLIESDQKAARPLLQDLVERLPKSAEARALLANSYLRSLEAAPALDHYRLAHALEPANVGVRHQMGLCAVALGDYEDALAIYRKAMEIAPREHSAAMAALMLHRLGKFADAANAYSKLLATLKRDHPEAPHALRGAAALLRDGGMPLSAERFTHELVTLYRLNPARIAASLVERDNSIDFHEWTTDRVVRRRRETGAAHDV